MASIPLPALAIKPPQQPDLMAQLGQLFALRSQANQQQLQQQQIQASQQENQMRQMQLNDAQTARQMAQDPKYLVKDSNGKTTGWNYEQYLSDLGSAGVGPQMISQVQQMRKTDAETMLTRANGQKAQLENQSTLNDQARAHLDAVQAETDPALRQQKWEAAMAWGQQQPNWDPSQYPRQAPDNATIAKFEIPLALHSQAVKEAMDIANTQKTQAETAKTVAETNFYKGVGLAPGVTPDMAAYAAYLGKGGKPEGWTAYKAQQEAAATQPYKMQTAQADAQARFAMEGMTKPVYAWNPQTNQKDLMSQTEALAQGRKVMTPVTAKEVSDDTMLINRLSDVRAKIGEYENALQQPISQKDRGNMAALLGTSETKVGVHPHGVLGGISFEIPMERVDAALSQENLKGLSANARDQLVAYRNAREALTGYTRVLSGSGRSSDTTLELNEQTLPHPAFTDPDFSRRSLGAFKQNLQVVGQGLPNIPGVKTPEQWQQQMTQPAQQPAAPTNGPPAPTSFINPSLMSLIGVGR